MFTTQNIPNAAKLMDSLRFLGYDNYAAVCDLIDNALDAEARNVWITIHQELGEPVITVADDGVGMSKHVLDEALKLGSLTERNTSSDLGKFGMGLVTAALSIARRTTVLTRQNGKVLKSVTDIDEVKKRNEFCKFLGEAVVHEVAEFNRVVGNGTGTIVDLTNCDGLQNRNTSNFSKTLKNKVGQIYRKFLEAGKSIYINGEAVGAVDPLMLDQEAELFSDETYDIKVKNAGGVEVLESIRVRLSILPDFGIDGNKSRGINQKNSGFSVLRNNREISSGETLEVFTKHNDLNRFRAELYFSSSLDQDMGVNFTKDGVDPKQAILDKIKEAAQGQVRTIRDRLKKARVSKEDQEIVHGESEKLIDQKAHLLIRPRPSKNGDGAEGSEGESRDYVQFLSEHLGKNGPIYDAELKGRVAVIKWNVDHPFYERFVLENKSDRTLISSVDFLIYSMATAELTVLNEETFDTIQAIKTVMSSNLRSLLA